MPFPVYGFWLFVSLSSQLSVSDLVKNTDWFQGYFWKTFPIDAIVVSPMLRAIGGGAPVCSAVVLALVANAVPAAKRSILLVVLGLSEANNPCIDQVSSSSCRLPDLSQR
jgi:hypothetical protein